MCLDSSGSSMSWQESWFQTIVYILFKRSNNQISKEKYALGGVKTSKPLR